MSNIKKVLFMGSKNIGLRVLQEMHQMAPEKIISVLTIDDTQDTRSMHERFLQYTKQNKIKQYIVKSKKNSEELIELIKPELCIVVGWYWLISNKSLESVPYGFIGIHNSLLPKYRGGSPLIWSIINGEKTVGFSIFTLTQGIDDGPIWAQEKISVEQNDYISDVIKKLDNKTINIFRNFYDKILNNEITPIQQNHDNATYCAQRFPKDGNIDWVKPANDIYNFIRSQSDPYPGAFTYYNDEKLKIWKIKLFEKLYYGTPGQIARIDKSGVYVICGDNRAVILEEVELKGQKRERANIIIKSIKGRFSYHTKDCTTP